MMWEVCSNRAEREHRNDPFRPGQDVRGRPSAPVLGRRQGRRLLGAGTALLSDPPAFWPVEPAFRSAHLRYSVMRKRFQPQTR